MQSDLTPALRSDVPKSEMLFRNFRSAHGVLVNSGLDPREADAVFRESFAAFFAGLALESPEPRAELARLVDAVERHLNNQGLSAAVRHPVRRFIGRFSWGKAA